jgi:membrane-bound inhibitor of C-type lysozyme
MKKYTLDYVESGSGEKFTGKGIEFWTKTPEAMLEFEGKKYNCELR